MNAQRLLRRLGIDGRAASILQWVVRMVTGMVIFEVLEHVVAPTLGVTILSPSQLIDRFLAWNHTFPTLSHGMHPSTGSPPLLTRSMESPLLGDVEVFVSLLAWTITLWCCVCLIAALRLWLEYCFAGPGRRAVMNRGEP